MTDPILAELRLLRMAKGLRGVDIAEAVGVDPASVSYWENGRRRPRLENVRAYAREVGCDLALVPRDEP